MPNQKELQKIVADINLDFKSLETQIKGQAIVQNETNQELVAIRQKIDSLMLLLKMEIGHENSH